ncbi:unnamed protein product [Colias eurytheme]|nr:unnamed protein product [Colias eurytheme]
MTINRSVYWWSEDIAKKREVCLRFRRQYTRTRRRRRATAEEVASAYASYRTATMNLQSAIAEAKEKAWNELLDGLNQNPWGRPYKMVLGKLRPCVPPLTETLRPEFTRNVVDVLFPDNHNSINLMSIPDQNDEPWTHELDVTESEMDMAIRRLSARNCVPGPDGIPGRAWALALTVPELKHRLRSFFSKCLKAGIFPLSWKESKLVLIKKPDRPEDSPSAYRPICLLDEIGKLFERIIAARLYEHLCDSGPDVSDRQFGFRRGRSTVDAILHVRSIAERATNSGKVALAVSLDIVNAFNSLPWDAIKDGLAHHNVPTYLRRTVDAYLRDRFICYVTRGGQSHRRRTSCGVPQGSVLGPILWNFAYDAVLRVNLPTSISVICYADDTLLIAEGESYQEATHFAELGISRVVNKIQDLGLKIAPHKTEALWFHKLPR